MSVLGKRKRAAKHPYLTGNFAPIQRTTPLTPCTFTGTIPVELVGGEYVRNGGNPVSNEDLGRDAHWFDGDGMLAGVAFTRSEDKDGQILPEFVNQYILTDLYLSSVATSPASPILPSIATLVHPASSLLKIVLRIFRTLFLVFLSHLPGSRQAIKKISVANTAILYHDGRALATCESGPPLRIELPGLNTVGWFDGIRAEGEPKSEEKGDVFGGEGLLSFMKEWTTAHPKVDPLTNEMILFHCAFAPPYVHYSIVPANNRVSNSHHSLNPERLLNAAVPRVSGAKMMHDFGVSRTHTIIMDLPLTLDPLNLIKNKPVVEYDSSKPSRFGIFPRRKPADVRWFETSACCIFHTANSWDSCDMTSKAVAVNLLACRLTSASLVFSAGNIAAPQPTQETVEEVAKAMPFFDKYDHDDIYTAEGEKIPVANRCAFIDASDLESHLTEQLPLLARAVSTSSENIRPPRLEDDQCRLYYYRFDISDLSTNRITRQYALAAIPFEFPTLRPDREMQAARYIYGCSTSESSFGAALGRAAKIDILVKVDVHTLLAQGEARRPRSVTGCVDNRSVAEVLQSEDPHDPIKCFRMPENWYAQEPRFVARNNSESEDDGYLIFYAFDESQLDDEGECPPNAVSEFWIIDAKNMTDVIASVKLPQRVPYGLHGNWFSERQIQEQRPIERVRTVHI